MTRYDILIVGAGHAGAQAAAALRMGKFEGTVGLLGDEPELPYERPPLSKDYLSGEKPFERLLLRPETFWEDKGVDLLLGKRVMKVDAEAHEVTTEAGEPYRYGTLIWATGGAPRRMTCAGHDLAGLHMVRSRKDVDDLMAELPGVKRVAVIGGGYIGLEAAAVLRKLDREVVLLEAEARVLSRVAGEELSRFYEKEHRGRGVDLRLNAFVECIEGENGRVTRVRLDDGEAIPCDMVIVGIGIIPAIEPLLEAGAEGGNGIKVDGHCRTSLPDIFAVGDCALHENAYAGSAAIRLESVQNANDQARVAVDTILGKDRSYNSVPWFWSDQYDLKLQTIGLSSGYDDTVVRGDPDERSFSVVYLKKGAVIALDCVNRPMDYAQGRKLVADRAAVPKETLAQGDVPLREMIT